MSASLQFDKSMLHTQLLWEYSVFCAHSLPSLCFLPFWSTGSWLNNLDFYLFMKPHYFEKKFSVWRFTFFSLHFKVLNCSHFGLTWVVVLPSSVSSHSKSLFVLDLVQIPFYTNYPNCKEIGTLRGHLNNAFIEYHSWKVVLSHEEIRWCNKLQGFQKLEKEDARYFKNCRTRIFRACRVFL